MTVEKKGPDWGTTKAISVMKDAMAQAMAEESGDITEAKLPLKLVVTICLFLLAQTLTAAGAYYNLVADIRSLQEAQVGLEDLVPLSEIQVIRSEIENLRDNLSRLEAEVDQPPTNLDHLRAIGEIRSDIRLVEQRIKFLERKL